MKRVLFILMTLSMVFSFISCSDEDDFLRDDGDYTEKQAELCKAWQLIGYGSNTKFHMIDEEYRKTSEVNGSRFYIIFKSDGTFSGRESINTISGEYSCKENQIKIGDIFSTKVYDAKGYKESQVFLDHLRNSSSYAIKDGNRLRLYYSNKEYLYLESMERQEHSVKNVK